MSTPAAESEVEIWNRAIQPEVGHLSPAAVRELLRLRLSESDVARVKELSEKASAGTVADAETQELDHYLNVGRALEFIKAKARLSLRDNAAGDKPLFVLRSTGPHMAPK